VYIDSNTFRNVYYAGIDFVASNTVQITNNYVNGTLQLGGPQPVAFGSNFGTGNVVLENNIVYDHCLGIMGCSAATVSNNYVVGCNLTGISIFGDENAAVFNFTNNTVSPPPPLPPSIPPSIPIVHIRASTLPRLSIPDIPLK
jgi:hypothetical protein